MNTPENDEAALWLDTDIPLLPLPLSAGWTLRYHQLYDVHPDKPVKVANCPGGDYTELFKSTLLVVAHEATGALIDVGWGPEADLRGAFYLCLYRNGDLDTPVREYVTRDPHQVIEWVRELMQESA